MTSIGDHGTIMSKTISHDLHSKWLVFKSRIYSASTSYNEHRNYPMITKVPQNITLSPFQKNIIKVFT